MLGVLIPAVAICQDVLDDGQRVRSIQTGKVYLILDREKRLIEDVKVFDRLFKNEEAIIQLDEYLLETMPTGKPIKNASLCKSNQAPTYLLIDHQKRHISNPEIFDKFGFDWTKVHIVSEEELKKYPTGRKIENPAFVPVSPLPCGTKDSYRN
jgi:hypothetical protein